MPNFKILTCKINSCAARNFRRSPPLILQPLTLLLYSDESRDQVTTTDEQSIYIAIYNLAICKITPFEEIRACLSKLPLFFKLPISSNISHFVIALVKACNVPPEQSEQFEQQPFFSSSYDGIYLFELVFYSI